MRLRPVLLATCVAVPIAVGAAAQQEADRRLDAAIARFRAALDPGDSLDIGQRRVDPVTGEATLSRVTLRHGNSTTTVEEVNLRDIGETRVGRATLRGLRGSDGAPAAAPAPAPAPSAAPGTKGPVAAPAPTPGSAAPAGGTAVMTIGRVDLTGLNLPNAAGGPRVDWATAAVDSMVVETVGFDIPNSGRAEAARLSLTGYTPGAAREALVEGMSFVEDPAKGQGRMRLGRARLTGAVLPQIGQPFDPWSFAADSAVVEGAALNVPQENVEMEVGRVQVDGWGEGRLTSARLEGFRMAGTSRDTGPIDMRLGRFAFNGIAARDTALAIVNQTNPPQAAPGQAQGAEAEGFTFSMQGRQVAAIGAIRARNDWDVTTPTTQIGRLTVEGVAVDLPPEAGGAFLQGMGYQRLSGGLENVTRLMRPTGQVVADPFNIRVDGMGTLGFTVDLRGYQIPQPGTPAPKPEDFMAMLAPLQVASMTIRYTDEGLIPRLVTQQARSTRMQEAQLREQFAQMALTAPVPGSTGKDSPNIAAIRQALASFARQPGTIEFAIRPRQPMPLLEFMNLSSMQPAQVAERLNLTATASPRR
ncbi:hypothetical protein [Muricoccus radiodurans]|uniref:hypothetical protein n=1 Tax=Muricoccus radiodurans TaxID=2231721 RepID=UPI003CEA9CEB